MKIALAGHLRGCIKSYEEERAFSVGVIVRVELEIQTQQNSACVSRVGRVI